MSGQCGERHALLGLRRSCFTDIEGSTRRWETNPEVMQAALADHDEVLRSAIEAHGGFLFKHTGEGPECQLTMR